MANTLTGLIPTIYNAMDVVSREMVGFIPAVARDSSAEQGAVGQTISSPVVPSMSAADITASNVSASGSDVAYGTVTMNISQARKVSFHLTGEEELSIGPNGAPMAQGRFAQAFRTLTNEIEADLAGLHVSASRAYGTAGTTPFATAGNLADFAQSNKILNDNGAPISDRHLVLGSAAAAGLSGVQSSLFKVNEAGSDDLLRRGFIGQVQNLMVHESQQVLTSTAGTGSSATTDNAGYSIGDTVLTLASAGTGTIVAGDVVTFAGDANQYVVASGDADVSNGGTITLAEPGLKVAMSAATKAITVKAAAARNLFFSRDAIQLATRAPALPGGGDMADDRAFITDPVSGLVFEVAIYRQYRQVSYEVGIAWGSKAVKPEHMGILLG